jgi:lipopolysaccharide export system ATP-binding protein
MDIPESNPTNQASKLEARDIAKVYAKRHVVDHVSYEVRQGECVGLLGPNGAGKTTSFYMIVGMVQPTEGSIFLDGEDITHKAMFQRARLGISYLPQEASVFRKLSVEENIMAILELQKLTAAERRDRCEELLHDFNITHIRKSKGFMLSGGERRRTEIARTLASDPKFVLLDEPFAGIDPIAVEDIMHMVQTLKHPITTFMRRFPSPTALIFLSRVRYLHPVLQNRSQATRKCVVGIWARTLLLSDTRRRTLPVDS